MVAETSNSAPTHQIADSDPAFVIAEYHEAAATYWKGVELGQLTLRNYVTANVLLVALIGALDSYTESAEVKSGILKILPLAALAISIGLLIALPYYFRQLENPRSRCEQIERRYGGDLFTKIGWTTRKAFFNAYRGFVALIVFVLVFWAYFSFIAFYGNFSLNDAVRMIADTLTRS